MQTELLPVAQIQARIHFVRGKRVMLDADLARFYGVATRDLNKAVTRNADRFPEDFAFHLTPVEAQNLKFQSGTSSSQPAANEEKRNTRRGYVHASGEVRLAFVQAKTVLNLFRSLALGKSEPYAELCRLFDRQTEQGSDMRLYTRLIGQAVSSITDIFQKRLASGLQGSRQFVLPTESEQPQSDSAFELVTWLVLLDPATVS